VRNNKPYEPLVKFWRNIQQNPSVESKKDLFAFLEANKMTITDDGCFIAYKKVTRKNGKLVDCRTRSMSNEIGETVSMPREEVDSNRNVTCSSGLHVAAYNYAQFSYEGLVLLQVKVNPIDVVSVPIDYGKQKMRVCKYKVLSIVNNKIDADKMPLVDKSTEKSMLKHSKKVNNVQCKVHKSNARKLEIEEHNKLVEKFRIGASEIIYKGIESFGFTAKEIISITCAHVPNIKTGELRTMNLKNKKSIVNKAIKLLEDELSITIKRK
jgi:hypothetical protein